MIKIEELRIGNLVSVKEDVLKPFLEDYGLDSIDNSFEVISIDNVHLNLSIDGLEVEYYLSDCEPIPLTEEWLLKFGFKYWEDIDQWYSPDNDAELRINHWTKGDRIGFYEEEYYINIETVHQLQNLYFALTGEELKID